MLGVGMMFAGGATFAYKRRQTKLFKVRTVGSKGWPAGILSCQLQVVWSGSRLPTNAKELPQLRLAAWAAGCGDMHSPCLHPPNLPPARLPRSGCISRRGRRSAVRRCGW